MQHTNRDQISKKTKEEEERQSRTEMWYKYDQSYNIPAGHTFILSPY
jgi:hypothetical protein